MDFKLQLAGSIVALFFVGWIKRAARMPVVNERDGLVGILALDDLLELLAEELLALAKLVKYEQKKETMSRR